MTDEVRKKVDELAERYRFSEQAVLTLFEALIAGHGTMAQFSHPEFGGMGQWTRGGMIMIGDMFDTGLRVRVSGLCHDLADLLKKQPNPAALDQDHQHGATMRTREKPEPWNRHEPSVDWWGTELGTPSSTGSQGNIRYAYFPAARRLAVSTHGSITVYDTRGHDITGFSQQQGSGSTLTFASQLGPVPLTSLPVVSMRTKNEEALQVDALTGSQSKHSQTLPQRFEPEPAEDIFTKIERLAQLRKDGVLSDEEFTAKKTELLARL